MTVDLGRYLHIREVGTALNHEIIDRYVSRGVLDVAGNFLGIRQGDKFVFASEDESSVLMDFALNDIVIDGSTAVQKYVKEVGGSGLEKEILEALDSSYTSLFKVSNVYEHSVLFLDLLNKGRIADIVDFNFARTAVPGLVVFFRQVPFQDMSMTSGVSFPFEERYEKYLLGRYKKEAKRVASDNENVKRFVSFYKLHKKYGIKVRYE